MEYKEVAKQVWPRNLKPGDKFWFQDDEYLLIETVDRCRDYAVNLTTYKLTKICPSERNVFVKVLEPIGEE